MPIYEYCCDSCNNKFEVLRSMSDSSRDTECPKCKKHSPHSVSVYKKGKERSLAAGVRRHELEKHGYGGQKGLN
jgi:putative FmdB family regulatory protein